MKILCMLTIAVSCHAVQFEYVLRWKVAGVVNYSQPMTLERCERMVKEKPHLRAACVPILK